jgi:hypothetical protein
VESCEIFNPLFRLLLDVRTIEVCISEELARIFSSGKDFGKESNE